MQRKANCTHVYKSPIEAGGGETLEGMRHRPVSGRKLEKLGQESFLGTVPVKFIA